MRNVLVSIQPKYCKMAADKECLVLIQKSAPKEIPFRGLIYATKPKKWHKCGPACVSDESLWFANGKVEICDGLEFWGDGVEDYQCLNGKVIGEFVCDKVEEFYCASVPYQKENNLGYGKFVDNGVYKVDGWHEGVVFERNDEFIDSMLNNNDLREMCLSAQELFDCIGIGKHLYGWHISDLKIYDKPKKLGEFRKPLDRVWGSYCNDYCDQGCISFGSTDYSCNDYWKWEKGLTRPPQSWMYVEEKIR